MATIKSFTDLSQSKTLSKILPPDSADMYYFRQIDNDYFPPDVESICPIPLFKDGKEDFNYDVRCWSFTALIDVLPDTITSNDGIAFKLNIKKNIIEYSNPSLYLIYKSVKSDNLIDTAYEMILKLHKLNFL